MLLGLFAFTLQSCGELMIGNFKMLYIGMAALFQKHG